MTTKTDIANQALSLIGADSISSFEENTSTARRIRTVYDTSRKALLRLHLFQCAVKRIKLSPLATQPEFGYAYQYQLPDDLIRIINTNTEDYVVETDRLLSNSMLQTQINTLGVGNKAYLTYAAMDADKANITTKSKITVTNDPDTTKNGDYQYDGTIFTKSAYDILTQAIQKASQISKGIYSDIEAEIDKLPVDWFKAAVPDIGIVENLTSYQGATVATYVLNKVNTKAIKLHKILVASSSGSGSVQLRAFKKSGTNYNKVRDLVNLTIYQVGINEFTFIGTDAIDLFIDEYLGFGVMNNGAVGYKLLTQTDPSYYNVLDANATVVDETRPGTTAVLQIAFYSESRLSKLPQYLNVLNGQINEHTSFLSTLYTKYIGGVHTKPSVQAGSAGIAQWIPNKTATSTGTLTKFSTYALEAGKVQVGSYTKIGSNFRRNNFVELTLVKGYNEFSINLPINQGDYAGLRTSVAGQTCWVSTTTGHDGIYSSVNLDDYTNYSVNPNNSFAFQFNFEFYSTYINKKEYKWDSKKYVSFGDSITWYNGQTYVSSHNDVGVACVGYQSYVVKELGCILDNRGRSGWTLPEIYSGEVNVYDYTNAYAVTLTSGANDHRKGVAVGTIKAIGSTFDTTTYIGALQASVEKIINSNKAVRLFLITPIRGWYSEQGTSDVPNPNGIGILSEAYVDAMKAVAKLYGLPLLDWYNQTGFNDLNKNYYLGDNPSVFTAYLLHPNNLGFQKMGSSLAAFLKSY